MLHDSPELCLLLLTGSAADLNHSRRREYVLDFQARILASLSDRLPQSSPVCVQILSSDTNPLSASSNNRVLGTYRMFHNCKIRTMATTLELSGVACFNSPLVESVFSDKLGVLEIAKRLGIDIPIWIAVSKDFNFQESIPALNTALPAARFSKIVIKPRIGCAGKGVASISRSANRQILAHMEQLRLGNFGDIIIQEHISIPFVYRAYAVFCCDGVWRCLCGEAQLKAGPRTTLFRLGSELFSFSLRQVRRSRCGSVDLQRWVWSLTEKLCTALGERSELLYQRIPLCVAIEWMFKRDEANAGFPFQPVLIDVNLMPGKNSLKRTDPIGLRRLRVALSESIAERLVALGCPSFARRAQKNGARINSLGGRDG